MASFKISAPGRIVLSGEHSVMYRRHCVATSLDLRTKLEFCELPNETEIKVDFPEIELIGYNISLEEVRKFFSEGDNIKAYPISVFEYVKSFITFNGKWCTLKQRLSLHIFFFLLYSIAHNERLEIKSFHVKVSTDIPGPGLGGSTSFVICLAACFLHWKCLQSGNHSIELNDQFLENVQIYTKHCEKYVQDYTCTMIDSMVCTHGKIMKCRFQNYTKCSINTRNIIKMKILLINSKIHQNKCERVEQLARLQHYSSMTFESLLNILDATAVQIYHKLRLISNASEQSLDSSSSRRLYNRHIKELKTLIKQNQQLLKVNRLSNDSFDNICSIANNYGLAGKLTGFGGGFAYILLPPSTPISHSLEVIRHLQDEGYIVKNTFINCEGIKIDN